MTTDIVVRYAENINDENEITNFRRYSISGDSIAAISWELSGIPRRKGGECLLKKMAKKILIDVNSGLLHVMVQLSAVQPDNAIVNYKKAWGLLKSRGVRTEDIIQKKDFITQVENGLILSCSGLVSLLSDGVVESLFNCEEKVYFSFINSEYVREELFEEGNVSGWMQRVWSENGVVFMLMGYLDEMDCELVALGNSDILNNYFGKEI